MDVTVPALDLTRSSGVVLAQQAAEGLGGLVLPFVFLALLYVLLIRPQAKRRKELVRLVSSLKVGDLVSTFGGIHGEIVDIDAETIDLAVSEDANGRPDVVIRFERNSVIRIIEKSDAPEAPGEGTVEG